MPTATPPAPPAVSQDSRRIEYDQFIDQQIRRTRATVKLVDLVSRVMMALAGLFAILLVAALVEHWLVPGGLSVFWRSALWLTLVTAGGWFVWRQIAPLVLQRINSVYAAQAIESHSPGLKNSLLNLLLFRQHRELVPDAVYRTVEEQAATRLATADMDAAVDRTGLIKIGYVLLAIVVLAGLYKVVSPKDPVATAGRVLMPWADIPAPTRVSILEIEPGAIRVARGETVEVSAAVAGLAEEEAVVVRYSTEDGQTVDFPIEMFRAEGEYRFRAQLPADPPAGAAPGVQQPMTYFIEAGDARSKEFAIAVVDAPTMVLEQIEYDYPDYTRRADRTQPDNGRIRALEGTRVTLRAQTNHPVRRAGIDLGADRQIDVPLTPLDGDDRRVAGDFVLELDPETRTQAHDLYALRFTDVTGQRNRSPVHYRLEIIPDLRPEVEILQPTAVEQELQLGATVPIEVEARDPDYALSRVTLFARTAEGMVLEQPMLEGEHAGRFLTRHPFTARETDFAVGDLVEYWVEAEDNRTPEPNRAVTDHQQFKITEPPPVEADDPALANQGQGGPQQPQQQENQDQLNQQPQQAEGQQNGGDAQQQQRQEQQQNGAGKGAQSEQQQRQEGQQGGEQQQGNGAGQQDAQQQDGGNGAADQTQQGDGEPGDPQQGGEGGSRQDPAAQQPDGAEQQATPDGQAPQQEGARQGGQAGQQGQEASGADESQPVPSDGSDDGSALERMIEHFNERQNGTGEQSQDAAERAPEDAAADGGQQPSPPQAPDGPRQDASQQEGDSQRQGARDESVQQSAEQQPRPSDEPGAQEQQQTGGEGAGEPQQQDGQPEDGQRQDQTGERTGAQDQQENRADQESGGGQQAEQSPIVQNRQRQAGGDQRQQPEQTARDAGTEADGEEPADPNGAKPGEQPQQQDGDPSQASRPNTSQGSPGAGEPSDESQAAPDQSEQAKPRDKRPQEGSSDDQQGGEEAAGSSRSRHESDSEGEEGGDRSGGGTTGGGQDAQRDGTGSPGQQTSADEGEGSSSEKGRGETSTGEGADREAGRRTGQAGEDAGRGSEQRSGQGDQPGGERAEGARPQPGETDGQERQANQESQPQDGDPSQQPQRGEPGQQAQQPQDGQRQDGRQPGSVAGNPETGGGDAGDALPPPTADGNAGPVGDEADLDYARKQTDLVLDRLENQLKEREVDPELLDKLGWSEDDLKKFVERWKNLKQTAKSEGSSGEGAQQELDRALRSLGPLRRDVNRGSGNIPLDELRELRNAPRLQVPPEFQDEIQAYSRGISQQE